MAEHMRTLPLNFTLHDLAEGACPFKGELDAEKVGQRVSGLVGKLGYRVVGPASAEGMAYLYNHHLSMNLMFEDTGPIRMLLIRLKPEAWRWLDPRPQIVDQFIEAKQPRFYGFKLQDQLAKLFSHLFHGSVEDNSPPWHTLIKTLEVCSHLFASLQQRPQTRYSKLNTRDAHRIHQAQQLLVADFQEPMSLAEICKQVGLGRDKLRQLFQQVYGTTPYQYFQEQRMHKAHRLIAQQHQSVMEAGYQVGYSHMGHFSQAFRKQFGYLPKAAKPSALTPRSLP